jgi:hypothetical protein
MPRLRQPNRRLRLFLRRKSRGGGLAKTISFSNFGQLQLNGFHFFDAHKND